MDSVTVEVSKEELKKESAYNWTVSIVESCENEFHYSAAEKIIDLFHKRYGEENINPEKGETTLKQRLALKMVNVVL
jgi:hypothetical protein